MLHLKVLTHRDIRSNTAMIWMLYLLELYNNKNVTIKQNRRKSSLKRTKRWYWKRLFSAAPNSLWPSVHDLWRFLDRNIKHLINESHFIWKSPSALQRSKMLLDTNKASQIIAQPSIDFSWTFIFCCRNISFLIMNKMKHRNLFQSNYKQ